MKKLYLIIAIGSIVFGYSQVGIGTASPNSNAALELNSNAKGLMISHVSLTSTNLATPLSAHVAGMTVYNTATRNDVSPGIYFNDGSSWNRMQGFTPTAGDVKQSVENADHDGWYILDGRAVSSLSTEARTRAVQLGFTSTLPNMSDRMIKGRNNEAFGSLGGTTSFQIQQANLPNITFNGTASTAGAHTHTYINRGNTLVNAGFTSFGTVIQSFNTATGDTRTTQSSGAHSHSISINSGGNGTSVNLRPRYLVVQTFIYLGI